MLSVFVSCEFSLVISFLFFVVLFCCILKLHGLADMEVNSNEIIQVVDQAVQSFVSSFIPSEYAIITESLLGLYVPCLMLG